MKNLLMILGMILALTACGKKGRLEMPQGSTYPRQYPAARNPMIEEEIIAPQADDVSVEVPIVPDTPTLMEINDEIAE